MHTVLLYIFCRKAMENLKMYNLDAIDPIRKLFGLPPAPKSPAAPRATSPALPTNLSTEAEQIEEEYIGTGQQQHMILEKETKNGSKEDMNEPATTQSGAADKRLEKELARLGIFVSIR
jgi:hypothetical protein